MHPVILTGLTHIPGSIQKKRYTNVPNVFDQLSCQVKRQEESQPIGVKNESLYQRGMCTNFLFLRPGMMLGICRIGLN